MNQETCNLCPRNCKTDRKNAVGFCGAGPSPTVAKVMLHQWEEPCICYGKGSGAIFFSGCQLKCVFCQNSSISRTVSGKELNGDTLYQLFKSLEESGACNINLVSPTPYTDTIIFALEKAKASGLSIPVVFNSGGYESVQTLKRLEGLVDIYLPDFKFYSAVLSKEYAMAENYAACCSSAIVEMYRQTGKPKWEGKHLESGLIVRHLILPNHAGDSIDVLNALAKLVPAEDIILSLMRQYTPMVDPVRFPKLARTLTSLEYNRVLKECERLGFANVYTQDRQSAGESYVPDFSIFFDKTN